MTASANSILRKCSTHPLVWMLLKRQERKSAENVQPHSAGQRSFRNAVSKVGPTLAMDESLWDIPIPIFLRCTKMLRNGTYETIGSRGHLRATVCPFPMPTGMETHKAQSLRGWWQSERIVLNNYLLWNMIHQVEGVCVLLAVVGSCGVPRAPLCSAVSEQAVRGFLLF